MVPMMTEAAKAQMLRVIPGAADLPSSDFLRLCCSTAERAVAPGTVLAQLGHGLGECVLVLSGTASAVVALGDESVIGPGVVIGQLTPSAEAISDATITAVTVMHLLVVPASRPIL